mmetsp:Transcript_27271/g.58398  ORF Transcript_27271/g.58398 Transcript_27271/m.58398 type:complete len:86 (+) Transcript_27271:33-290(+)
MVFESETDDAIDHPVFLWKSCFVNRSITRFQELFGASIPYLCLRFLSASPKSCPRACLLNSFGMCWGGGHHLQSLLRYCMPIDNM